MQNIFLKTNQISAISLKTACLVVKSSLAPSLRWSCLKLSATDDGWKDVDLLIFHSPLTFQLHTKTSCFYIKLNPSCKVLCSKYFKVQSFDATGWLLVSLSFMTLEIFLDRTGEIQTESVGEI